MPETSPDATSPSADPIAPAVKTPGVLRKSAVIFLVLVAIIGVLMFPLVVEPWIVGKVKSTLAGQGLELAKGSELSVSVFGGAVTGKALTLRETGQTSDVFTATTLNADIALIDSVTSGDVVIESLVIEGLTGNLRRTNGRVPVLDPTGEPGKPTDWLGLGKQLMDWYKKYAPAGGEDKAPAEPGKEPAPEKPAEKAEKKAEKVPAKPTVAIDWPHATRYLPQPQPGGKWPRVLIRHLSINGTTLGLPDESPFDLTGFALTGTNVALRLNGDETMDLKGDLTTRGSGPMALAINRQGGRDGTMKLDAKQVPIEALSNPQISGNAMTGYGAKGLADLTIDTTWTGWKQTSAVTSTLSQMTMQPDKDAGAVAHQFASAINAFGGKPVAWSPRLGGTLAQPVFTDNGLDSLKASALGAAKDAAKDKAVEEGQKQLDKNPQLKGATDKAKDLFKGLGK